MRSVIRGTTLALVGTLLVAGDVWAHPGHVGGGGLVASVVHALSSPYHVSVVVGVAVLVLAWRMVARPGRMAVDVREGEDEV